MIRRPALYISPVAVFLVLATTGVSSALWSSTATTTSSVAAGTNTIAQTNFSSLAQTYTSAALQNTTPITVQNTGTITAPFTLTLGAQAATTLATGAVVRTWGPTGAICDNTVATPAGATTSNWTNIAPMSGTLAPNATAIYCIRTSVTAAQASSLSGISVVGTLALTSTVGSWVSTASANATQIVTDTTAPSAPGAPVATETSGYSTKLTWAASTDNVGVTAYEVLRDGAVIATINALTYTDAAITDATAYNYTIRARDAANNVSAPSGATSVTTLPIDNNTFYQARNVNSGFCIDASANGTINDTPLTVFNCDRDISQNIKFIPLSDGYYRVGLEHAPALAWDIAGAGTGDGIAAVLYGFSGQTSQQWRVVALPGNQYSFVPRHSGRCLEVGGNSLAVNVQLQQLTCNNTTAQAFFLNTGAGGPTATGTPVATETSGYSTKLTWTAATAPEGISNYDVLRDGVVIATSVGTSYVDVSLNDATTYVYTIRARSTAGIVSARSLQVSVTTLAFDAATWYQLRNPNTNLCVGVSGGLTANETPLIKTACANATSQQFKFEAVGDGLYRVVPRHAPTTLVWDIAGGPTFVANGNTVFMYQYLNATNQKWRVIDLGNGNYSFRVLSSAKCLEVELQANRQQLIQYDCNSARAQGFTPTAVP